MAVALFASAAVAPKATAQTPLPYTRTWFTAPYAPITAAGGASTILVAANDSTRSIPLPFSFALSGVPYSTSNHLAINANGFAFLSRTPVTSSMASQADNSNLFVPITPNATLAPWYDDLNVAAVGSNPAGRVLYQVQGTVGSRRLIVQWTGVSSYANTVGGQPRAIHFQLALFEGTDVIEFRYGSVSGASASTLESASIGIEDSLGGNGRFLDGVTGSKVTSHGMMTTDKWPVRFLRFTPGTPTPLSAGTYDVGVGQTYPSLSEAVADLNHRGVNGAVTLRLTDPLYDNTPSGGSNAFPILIGPVAGTSATNRVMIEPISGFATLQHSGTPSGRCGNQSLVNAIDADQEPILALIGADYMTFIELSLIGGSQTDRGLLVIPSSGTDGAQDNTFRGVSIALSRNNSSSIGIQQRVVAAPISAAGTNSRNRYHNISISNVYAGISLAGHPQWFDDACEVAGVGSGTTTIGGPVADDIGNGTLQTFGIRALHQSGIRIYNTHVRSVTGAGSGTIVDGIVIDNIPTSHFTSGICEVFNNRVDTLNGNHASGGRVSGIRVNLTGNTGSVARIYNNYIWGLSSTSTATDSRRVVGIFAQEGGGGAGATFHVDFNSVRLAPTSVACPNSCFEIGNATSVTMQVRNNVFANFTGAQTMDAAHFAWVTPAVSAIGAPGSVSDHNVLHINVAESGFVGRAGGTSQTTLNDWQLALGNDASSRSGKPQFVSPTDLHIQSGIPTPVESGGSTFGGAIPWAMTDFDGNARNASTPDIGADEGAFTLLPNDDMAAAGFLDPPDGGAIVAGQTFAPKANFENAGVNVLSDIPVRYRIQGPLPSTATVYDETAMIVSLGSGVSQAASFPSVAIEIPGNYAMIATSELSGDTNIANDEITGSLEIAGPMSGDYEVGAARLFPFNTLTHAVERLSLVGVSGSVRLLLVDSDYSVAESFPIVIGPIAGSGPTHTVTIRPAFAAMPTITGADPKALLVFDGADYITLDGSNSPGGTSRDLTLRNTHLGGSAAVVWGQTSFGGDPVTNVAVRNAVLSGSGSIEMLIGVGFGGTTVSTVSGGTLNHNNRVENCDIRRAQYGIYSSGASAVSKNSGTVIADNRLNAPSPDNVSKGGILVRFENGTQISGNRVGNITSPSTAAFGIALGLSAFSTDNFVGSEVSNATISNNYVTGVVSTDPSGQSAVGIATARVTTGTTTIVNNMVAGVFSISSEPDLTAGILTGAGTGSITRVLFNSVSMTGSRSPATAPSFALAVGGADPSVEIRNNIFSNTQTSSGGGDGYTIGLAYNTYSNLTSNTNDFFQTGPVFAVVGGLTNTPDGDVLSLASWRSVTGKDANSISADPQFKSATDLHIQKGSPPVSNAGTVIAGITTDIDGELGNRATTPDIGADEFGTYRLTVATQGNGSVVKNPNLSTYAHGAAVQLTANPAVGHHFVGWSGDLASASNPLNLTMESDLDLTATFAINTYSLDVTVVGDGAVGKVPDQATYTHGTVVTLTGTPGVGEDFVGWSGDTTSSANPLTLTMTRARNLTATFSNNVVKFNVDVVGAGSVAKSPDMASYATGTLVTLTATPDPGHSFIGWAGDTSGADNPLQFTVVDDKLITAVFTTSVNVGIVGSGMVTKAPDQIAYTPGGTVVLTATPAAGNTFIRWSGDTSTTANPITLATQYNRNVVAEFTTVLDVTIVGSGSVQKTPDQPNYLPGTVVELVAAPEVGWSFMGWSGDTTTAADTLIVTMSDDKALTATFEINEYSLGLTSVGSGSLVVDPDQSSYTYGTVVQITATPDVSHTFLGWGGDASGGASVIEVTMDDDKAISALFTTRLDVSITGSGAVMVSPDSVAYTPGTVVQLLADPGVGHHFVGWTGDTSATTNPLAIVLDDNVSLTATFEINMYTLDLHSIGEGYISENPVRATYAHGDTVTLTAIPDFMHTFLGWSGDTSGTDTPIEVVMNESKAFIARFTAALNVAVVGRGTVLKDPDQFAYAPGDTVELTATPDAEHVFVGWSGDTATSENPILVVLDESRNLTANFTTTLTVQIVGPGSVVKNPDQATYFPGTSVELIATGDPGYRFDEWSGDTISSMNPLELPMDDNKTVVATFVEAMPPSVQVTSPNGGETLRVGLTYVLEWTADDNVGVASVDLTLSRGGPAGPFETIAAGVANSGSYNWLADGDEATEAYFRVVAYDSVGNIAFDLSDAPFEIVNVPLDAPVLDVFPLALAPVWPNPARGQANVEFALPSESFVRVAILDVQGRLIAELANGRYPAGRHQLRWTGLERGGRPAAGLYFVRMSTKDTKLVRRFTLVH